MPEGVILRRIRINSFVDSAMNGKVGLLIAFQIEFGNRNPPRYRGFEDGRPDRLSFHQIRAEARR